jgi:hypothetical protein
MTTTEMSPIFSPNELLPDLRLETIPRPSLLRDNSDFYNSATSYAKFLFARLRIELVNQESPRLPLNIAQDQIVVDMAAGPNPYGFLIAQLLGAKAYIGIDLNYSTMLERSLSERKLQRWIAGIKEEDPFHPCPKWESYIPHAVINSDMLSVLKAIPNTSVSVFGIGLHCVLPDEYVKEVNAELCRVVSNTGFLMTYPEDSGLGGASFDSTSYTCAELHRLKNLSA